MTRRPTPIRGRGANTVRYTERGGGSHALGGGTSWASCQTTYKSGFKDTPSAVFTKGFYLSNSDLALIGLAATIPASLAFAYIGAASAYFVTGPGGLLSSSASIGQALLASGAAGGLSGLIRPRGATFAELKRPCSENAGVNF